MARNNRNSSRQRIESYVYHNGGVATSDEISLEFKISPKEAAGRCSTSPYLIKVGREKVTDPAFGDVYYLSYWGHLKVLPHEEILELYWSRQLQPRCMRKVKSKVGQKAKAK